MRITLYQTSTSASKLLNISLKHTTYVQAYINLLAWRNSNVFLQFLGGRQRIAVVYILVWKRDGLEYGTSATLSIYILRLEMNHDSCVRSVSQNSFLYYIFTKSLDDLRISFEVYESVEQILRWMSSILGPRNDLLALPRWFSSKFKSVYSFNVD